MKLIPPHSFLHKARGHVSIPTGKLMPDSVAWMCSRYSFPPVNRNQSKQDSSAETIVTEGLSGSFVSSRIQFHLKDIGLEAVNPISANPKGSVQIVSQGAPRMRRGNFWTVNFYQFSVLQTPPVCLLFFGMNRKSENVSKSRKVMFRLLR